MSDLNADALHVSQVLDENTGRLDDRFAPHERIHGALSRRGAVPCERPSVDIGSLVMARIGAARTTPQAARAWPLGLAASLTLLAGLGWLVAHTTTPTAVPIPRTSLAKASGSASRSFSAIINPLTKSDGELHASIEAPFLEQARLIREDTQQGVDMVLSRLPLGSVSPAK